MINPDHTLFDITEKFPETIPVFVAKGFPQMADASKRASMGKNITLQSAAAVKKLDLDSFTRLLEEALSSQCSDADITLSAHKPTPAAADDLKVVGILPCPVRIPLMEAWNDFLTRRQGTGKPEVKYELKAASMGLDWVQQNIDGVENPDKLPDLFISAGFDMFFDKQRFGRFRRQGIFSDLSAMETYNGDFAGVVIKDPRALYSILAVVPALFLVNTEELGDREAPRSWEDLLDPRFEKSVSLPVSDFDLFNAILLNIYKMYGDKGVQALGRSLLESLHPAEMVKSEHRKQNKPAVTIMPYFFSKMVKDGGPLTAVWPEDGAILSPIFMLAKTARAKELQELVDFFASEDIGNLLAGQGLFPSTHPAVKNILPQNSSFMWLGWDYIEEHDLSELINHCNNLFNNTAQATEKSCGGGCCQ